MWFLQTDSVFVSDLWSLLIGHSLGYSTACTGALIKTCFQVINTSYTDNCNKKPTGGAFTSPFACIGHSVGYKPSCFICLWSWGELPWLNCYKNKSFIIYFKFYSLKIYYYFWQTREILLLNCVVCIGVARQRELT